MTTQADIPDGATHTSEGYFYRVTDRVQVFEYGEWTDCRDAYNLDAWLEVLEPIVKDGVHKSGSKEDAI